MVRKIIGVIVSLAVGILLVNSFNDKGIFIPGFIASMLTFIYFEMPDRKK